MLDHVPEGDHVVAALGQRSVFDRAAMHLAVDARVGDLRTPARRLDTGDIEAGVLRQREERADVAADVEQVARAAVLLYVGEALGEGLNATLLLVDVRLVFDVAVVLDNRLVVRARIHVHEVAGAALDDAAVLAERARGARVVHARVGDTRADRILDLDAVIVGAAKRTAHEHLGLRTTILRRRLGGVLLLVLAHRGGLPKRAVEIGGENGPARAPSPNGRLIMRPATHQPSRATAIPTRISEM